ncbi:phosphoglucosamine mutase [Candidatus Woesearchaeota archaeon]|nr:phosphoglucosamine mutase [Candidatus Woesearchaeota archaeon]
MSINRKKLFGTDGIRGTPGKSPLTQQEIEKIGRSFAAFLVAGARVLCCMDTRATSAGLLSGLKTGLLSSGADVLDAGVLNTPAAAYLTLKLKAGGAAIVSASHNPAEENGIKFFTAQGTKLSESQEQKIEGLFFSGKNLEAGKYGRQGEEKPLSKALDTYAEFACSTARQPGFGSLKAALDCANGAAYMSAPRIMQKLGVKLSVINNLPDGGNINSNCGSEHPEGLAKRVVMEKADLGIALDGDADRAVLVDEKGSVLTGDQLLGIAAISMAKKGTLAKKKVVVTHYSNYGLEQSLAWHGIKVIRSDVGDQKVASEMRKHGLSLGGEQSGHVIFAGIMPTGDGIITALQIMNVMREEGKTLSELALQIKLLPQAMLNVPIKQKKPIRQLELHKAIHAAQKELGSQGRVFVRYSGTQSLLRVMVEGKSEKQINNISKELAEKAKKELG